MEEERGERREKARRGGREEETQTVGTVCRSKHTKEKQGQPARAQQEDCARRRVDLAKSFSLAILTICPLTILPVVHTAPHATRLEPPAWGAR